MTYVEVYCDNCGRQIGVSRVVPRNVIFCDKECASAPSPNPNLLRDDMICYLFSTLGWTKTRIWEEGGFNISRERIRQVLAARGLS